MSSTASPTPAAPPPQRRRRSASLLARGEPMIWLTGGACAVCVLAILGLLLYIAAVGFDTFWPRPLERITTASGRALMGEVAREDRYRLPDAAKGDYATRKLYRIGNFDVTGERFVWIPDHEVTRREVPPWAVLLERQEWGNAYGTIEAIVVGDEVTVAPAEAWAKFDAAHESSRQIVGRIRGIESGAIGEVSEEQDHLRLQTKKLDLRLKRELERLDSEHRTAVEAAPDNQREALRVTQRQKRDELTARHDAERAALQARHDAENVRLDQEMSRLRGEVMALRGELGKTRIVMRTEEGHILPADRSHPRVPVRAEKPGTVRWVEVAGAYAELTALAEESAPAQKGLGALMYRTPSSAGAVLQVVDEQGAVVQSVPLPPLFRSLAADGATVAAGDTLLLEERPLEVGQVVRAVPANQLSWGGRLGTYLGRWWEYLSGDPREANTEGGVWPAIFGTVMMTLIMAILVVPLGVIAALYLREYAKQGTLVSIVRISVNNLAGVPSIVFGVFGLGFLCYGLGGTLDQWFFPEYAPDPRIGKTAMLWASLTLALLTLPVVIVATEEALAAVPRSMREGSYGCGASKWQTIRRIVLPRAMPGIMTGMILAVARGAGEVAPLMLVGAVKLAPELPISAAAPFFGSDRSFMHLGFHIYDLGFQSPDSEAARPLLMTTTLLLIGIIVLLNVLSMWLRARLRRKFAGGQF